VARSRRPSTDLIVLSASALVGVYAVGYVITEPGAVILREVGIAPTPAAITGHLHDGTYIAAGHSQFGDVFVTVAIEQGRITQVWINAVTTTFPSQTISMLPGEVVERQSAAVDVVSGATASSSAFIQGVEVALKQAQG
jgi:uncharacterized protein with FMN-binding domain